MIDRALHVENLVAFLGLEPHAVGAGPGLHPHALHLRLDLAVPVVAHAAARAVAQVLRAVHRARHAGRGKRALPAHLAIEQEALGHALDALERLLQLLVADLAPQRMQRDQRLLEDAVKRVEATGMAHGPQTGGVHSPNPFSESPSPLAGEGCAGLASKASLAGAG